MKLTKDNYELIMFDLLEGNIPSSDETALLQQIEQDEFFRSEWNLFKNTILVADEEVIYTKKDDLLKKETKVIRFPFWISAAVAASLVFAFFIFIPKNQDITTPQHQASEQTKPASEETSPLIEDVDEPEKQVADLNIPNTERSAAPIKETVTPTNDVVTPLENNVPEEIEQEMANPYANYVANTMSNTNTVELDVNYSLEVPEEEELNYLVVGDVTSTPVERITNKTIHTIGKLRQPSMKISPNWNARALTVEFETTGYHGMASLTPFKKKQ